MDQVLQKVMFPEKSYSSGISGTISYVPKIYFFVGYIFVFCEPFWLQNCLNIPANHQICGYKIVFLIKKLEKTKTYPLKNQILGT